MTGMVPKVSLPFWGVPLLLLLIFPLESLGRMEVDLYVHKDKFGKSLKMDVGDKDCTNVPRLWANLTQSVDTHGSCLQFYDGKDCKGRIAVIQPFHTVHQMDLSLISFHNAVQSLSPCGPKVPSGRYVIQSAVDASMLTVQKHENEFARVNTLPPQAFIPKAQQWEVTEKQANEYDIMPRVHETNYPVTYDGEGMKGGNFLRKVWKIESVGRGRYIIKSEWSGKCLYKTRVRTVEEHDCRAWSPNQEWVLRPLIAPAKPSPASSKEPQALADGVNFQVSSKVVEKYLAEQKVQREKDKGEDDRVGAVIEPYKIRYKKNKDTKVPEEDSEEEDEEDEEDTLRGRKTPIQQKKVVQVSPPGPEVMYSRLAAIPQYDPLPPRGRYPGKFVSYVDGVAPIYQDSKVEDPVFPEFLLHAASAVSEEEEDDEPGPKYSVTRRPKVPEPEGHPDYIPGKKKYDGRVKTEKAKEVKKTKNKDDESDETQSDEDSEEISVTPASGGTTKDTKKKKKEEESREDDTSNESQEDDAKDKDKEEEEEEVNLDNDDPAADVAGFMKLLFQGINDRLTTSEKQTIV